MKIALIQQPAGPDRTANIKKGMEAVREAAANQARIVAFAELAFDPFFPQNQAGPDRLDLAETIPGPATEVFSGLARELGIVIILNLFEREGEDTYDTSPVIAPDGSLLGKTRMVHVPDYCCFYERGYYTPGDLGAPVYHTEFGTLGVAICYDRHYPEYLRALALAGAEIVFIPQAGAVDEWPEGLYEAEMRAASFQNGFFTALCNRVGREEKLTFAGESFISDPFGKIIARAGQGSEEILYGEIELDMIRESSAHRLFLPDRRPELYARWLSASGGNK